MTLRQKALFAIFLVALLWGSAGTVGKLLIREAPPFVAVFYRFAGATLVVLPFFLATNKPKNWFAKLLPLALFNSLNVLLYYSGLARSTANTGALLGAMVPLLTAVASYFLIHEPVARNKFFGIIVGLLGAVLIVLVPVLEKSAAIGTDLLGNLYFVGSTFAWTFYIVRSRFSATGLEYNATLATFVNFLMCTVTALAACLYSRQALWIPALLRPSYFGLYLYTVFGVTVITFFLFQWAVQHVSATTASLKEYLQLVIGVAVNAAVLGERFTPVFVLGSILVIIGVIMATGERLSKKIFAVLSLRTT